ncbi:hypothetical protein DR32_002521 [Salmonella enterica subsp. enterica]|nr:hypothetical protein [Salmonella enterica subsp. enterica serovar Thompson]EDT8810341.1 hypothetical protein [Salmonella enterica subsp. enterica serovar Thompson]EDV3545918.1 hypothetical protein [Salmonella enterica subsp. enterica]EDV9554318.1 hypothetical protein [Salmonella enterica subsp. enterica serovar Thompson]EEC0779614.1 hypothetical protein [Salmonella enterica subsp. enterica serovar Hvittingfoss]
MRFRVVFPVASGADCPNSSNHWLQEQQLLTFTEFCCVATYLLHMSAFLCRMLTCVRRTHSTSHVENSIKTTPMEGKMANLSNSEIKLLSLDMIIRELILILDKKELTYIQNNLDNAFKYMDSDISLNNQDIIRLKEAVNFMFLHRP